MTMKKRTKIFIAGAAIVGASAAAGTGLASADGGDDTETPIEGSALERASTAALDHTGEGKVTETEVGDEESYYEVEVTLDDGREVDVQLDKQFNVVGSEGEDASEDEADG
jgi:uncharacterized membrane protein YkoI